jgi:hypothetical protein
MKKRRKISRGKAREIVAGLEEKVEAGELRREVLSSLTFPDKGQPCKHGRENWFTLGCMQHDYLHVVGMGCYVCRAQWFFEGDWRTDECRQYKGGPATL